MPLSSWTFKELICFHGQSALPGFVSNVIKGLKGVKEEQNMNYKEGRETVIAHLESIFSRFPFSDTFNAYDLEDLDIQIGEFELQFPP